MASYLKREISEWNTTDLSKWLLDNKYPGISELCQNNSLSGYDLFYITDDTLKNEFGLNSFHERQVTLKLIKKLIYEHLKLNIINSNGDNVILTLDNNPNTSLGELSEYIGGMFNINPKDILYKDTSKTEVLSPSLKIVELLILYPRLYKTLNVFNMKDYRQSSGDNDNNLEQNENLESKDNDLNINNPNNNNNGSLMPIENTLNESDYRKDNKLNNEMSNQNRNVKMNFDYKMERGNDDNRIIYNEERERNLVKKNKEMIYNDDYEYEIRNKEENEKRYYRRDKNETPNENSGDDNYNNQWENNNNIKYKARGNYLDKENNEENEEYIRQGMGDRDRGYASYRNKKMQNLNDRNYQENYNKQYKNYDKKGYYDNSGD
jgi:hypothetical protein